MAAVPKTTATDRAGGRAPAEGQFLSNRPKIVFCNDSKEGFCVHFPIYMYSSVKLLN